MGRETLYDDNGISASIDNGIEYMEDIELAAIAAEHNEIERADHANRLAYELADLPKIPGDYREFTGRAITDPEDRIDENTLQRETRTRGKGGSKNKGRKKAVRPLTPHEIMTQRIQRMNAEEHLAETETQRAERLVREERDRIDANNRVGRPRRGVEVREFVGARVEPAVRDKLRRAGITPGEAIERFAEILPETIDITDKAA